MNFQLSGKLFSDSQRVRKETSKMCFLSVIVFDRCRHIIIELVAERRNGAARPGLHGLFPPAKEADFSAPLDRYVSLPHQTPSVRPESIGQSSVGCPPGQW